MNVWGLPLAGFAWSFCPHKPPAIHLSQIRLSCPVTGSHSQLLPVSLWTCSHDSLYSPISSLGGSSFPCVPSLSYRCKKNCWFFTLVSFLRVKAEQWHLSSSRIEPEKWKFYRVLFTLIVSASASLSLFITIQCRKSMWVDGGCLQTRKGAWAGKQAWLDLNLKILAPQTENFCCLSHSPVILFYVNPSKLRWYIHK